MKRVFEVSSCFALVVIAVGLSHGGDKKSQEIKGWGKVVDPDSDCTVKVDKGRLTIAVPGTNHNLNPRFNLKAPRVMQMVEGNFVASVKVTGDWDPGEKASKPSAVPFYGAGLLLWQDEKNLLRLERDIWWRADLKKHVRYPPLVEYYKDGVYQKTNPISTFDEFFKGKSTYLKLERKGDKALASYSHDGKEWTMAKEITVELQKKLQIGVAAVNGSEKALTVVFEDFKLVTGK